MAWFSGSITKLYINVKLTSCRLFSARGQFDYRLEEIRIMDEKTLPVIDSVFFPYYVNQNRLLDIYAILNKGFSEYEEIKEG